MTKPIVPASSVQSLPVGPRTWDDRRSPYDDGLVRRKTVLGLPAPGSAGGVLRKPGTIASFKADCLTLHLGL